MINLSEQIRDLVMAASKRCLDAATVPLVDPGELNAAWRTLTAWSSVAAETLEWTSGFLSGLAGQATVDGVRPVHLEHVGRMRAWVAPNGAWCVVVDECDPDILRRNGAALSQIAQAMGGVGMLGVVGSVDLEDADLTEKTEDALIASRPATVTPAAAFVERLAAMARDVVAQEQRADPGNGSVCPLPGLDGRPFVCGCGPDGLRACRAAGVAFRSGEASPDPDPSDEAGPEAGDPDPSDVPG